MPGYLDAIQMGYEITPPLWLNILALALAIIYPLKSYLAERDAQTAIRAETGVR